MERTGHCLCGAVQYTATLPEEGLGACHCEMCRRWTGGPYVSVRTLSITFHSDETLATYTSSHWAERGFCTTCGSSLFYRLTVPGRDLLMLAAGSLDDLSGLALDHEVFIDRRPDAWCFAGELSGRTSAEVMGG